LIRRGRRKRTVTVKIRMPPHILREMKRIISNTIRTMDDEGEVPEGMVQLVQALGSKLQSTRRSLDLSYDESAAFMAIYDSLSERKAKKEGARVGRYIH